MNENEENTNTYEAHVNTSALGSVSASLAPAHILLDRERANEQSHATTVRPKPNREQTESEGKKDLIQAQQDNEVDSSRQF